MFSKTISEIIILDPSTTYQTSWCYFSLEFAMVSTELSNVYETSSSSLENSWHRVSSMSSAMCSNTEVFMCKFTSTKLWATYSKSHCIMSILEFPKMNFATWLNSVSLMSISPPDIYNATIFILHLNILIWQSVIFQDTALLHKSVSMLNALLCTTLAIVTSFRLTFTIYIAELTIESNRFISNSLNI